MLAGSLAAILLLAAAAGWLGLGGDIRLTRESVAQTLDAEGFDAVDVAVDRGGIAALAKDADGRHLLIRRHGVHFVTRLLRPPLDARLDQTLLTLGTGERAFGRITLDLGNAASNWAAGLRNVK